MDRLMSRLFGTLALGAMLILITGTAYSQTDSTKDHKMYKNQNHMYQDAKYDKDVADAASILRTKVDLTMEQTTRVEGILQDYKDNASKKDMNADNKNMSASTMSTANNSTLNKINDVLTSDQKTKFDNVKMQWWSDTQKKLAGSAKYKDAKPGTMKDTTWNK